MAIPKNLLFYEVASAASASTLLCLAASSREALGYVREESKTRFRKVVFSAHRGNWVVPRPRENKKSRDPLHYGDSLLSAFEDAESWRSAQLAAAAALEARGKTFAEQMALIEKEFSRSCIGDMLPLDHFSWQRGLFVATYPSVARAMPRTWSPAVMNELVHWVHHNRSSCKGIALKFLMNRCSILDQASDICCAQIERVIKHIAEFQAQRANGWVVKENFFIFPVPRPVPRPREVLRPHGQRSLDHYFQQ